MDPQPQLNKCNSLQTTVYAFQWTRKLEMGHLVVISLSNTEHNSITICPVSPKLQVVPRSTLNEILLLVVNEGTSLMQ